MVLPLHVFEPRYRALVQHILDGDKRFGVVMIEKGLDIGGEDQRSSFGTVAEVVEAEEFPDGRWAVITVGVERFRVDAWLPDDPYPQAEIELWPDDEEPVDDDVFAKVAGKFRRCMALASEAGVDVGQIQTDFEPGSLGTMQMAAMLPVGPFDKQKLLAAPGPVVRLTGIEQVIDETLELIEHRLQGN